MSDQWYNSLENLSRLLEWLDENDECEWSKTWLLSFLSKPCKWTPEWEEFLKSTPEWKP